MALPSSNDQVSIGSSPDNDVVLAGAGVAPHHARIVRREGQLFFTDLGAGAPTTANGAPIAPGQPMAFDFRTVFAIGGVPVPLAHPAISMHAHVAGPCRSPQRPDRRRPRCGARVARHRPPRGERPARHGDARPNGGRRPRLHERHVGRGPSNPAEPADPARPERGRRLRSGPDPGPRRSRKLGGSSARATAPATGRQGAPAQRREAQAPQRRAASPPQAPHDHRRAVARRSSQSRRHHHRPHARQPDRRPAPAGQLEARADRQAGRPALPRGPRQRQRHLRSRPAPRRPDSAVPVPNGEKVFIGPMPLADPHRRTARSTSSSRTRPIGRASRSTRSKRGTSSSRCPIATTRRR